MSALKENEKYLDSIQGKIDQFNNAVQTMWSNTLDDEWVKRIVEIGTFLVESIDNLGLIKALLIAIGTIAIQKNFKGDLFGGLFGDMSSVDSVKKRITDLEATYERAKAKFQASPSDKTREAMESAEKNLNAFKETNQPIIDADIQKTALNEQLEKLKTERAKLQGDLQVAQNDLASITADGIQEDLRDYIEIDTSQIDDQILGVQEKLNVARQQLAEIPKKSTDPNIKAADWDYYKSLGSSTPAKDRDQRFDDKKQEIADLEAQLDNLQIKKDQFVSSEIKTVVAEPAKAQVDDLTHKLDDANKAIQQTELELKNVETQAAAAGNAGRTAGQKIKSGFKSAAKSVGQFAKQVATSMLTTYAITTVLELLSKLGTAIGDWIKGKSQSFESLQEEFEDLNNDLSKTKSEISRLEGELSTANSRIEELTNKGALTFVEQEELSKLQSVTAELKSQITLQETLKKSQQQGVNAASINATDAYLGTSFMSDKTRTERQEEAKETGKTWGQALGMAAGVAIAALLAPVTGGLSLGAVAVGAGAGAFVGGGIGGAIGSEVAGSVHDSEQTVEEAMDSMLETRAKLKKEQDTALAERDSEAYNEATEALRTYDARMAKHISQIQQNYNAMDWESAKPDIRKEMKEYADWLDTYNISMGTDGAKSSAIARIFGDEAEGGFAKAKQEIDALKEKLSEAKKSGEGIDEARIALEGFKLNLSDEEIERLHKMGIYLYEVEDYFKDVVEVESDFIDNSMEGVVRDINKVADGLSSLKAAFDEVIEAGTLTAKTITSLQESLDIDYNTDADELLSVWNEYLKVMMSGTASTEEMLDVTERLTQAWLEDALVNNELTPETKMAYIAQLRELGVDNAEEYVNDLLQKNMVEDLEKKMSSREAVGQTLAQKAGWSQSEVDSLTDAEINAYAEKYAITDKRITEEHRKEVAKRYGVDEEVIDEIAKKLQEKHSLEVEMESIEDAEEKYKNWLKGDGINKGIEAIEEDLKSAEKKLNGFNPNNYTSQSKTVAHTGFSPLEGYYTYYSTELSYIDELGNELTETQFNQLNEQYNQYLQFKQQYDKLWAEGQAKGYIVDGEIINPDFKAELDNIQGQIDDIVADIDENKTVDVQIQLDLQNKSELVDDIQGVFDTLKGAVKEFNENGYMSVDTVQSLLSLDANDTKYLSLLQDENGQLQLNQQALLEVAEARMMDLGIKKATSVIDTMEAALNDDKIEKARELTNVTYGLTESTWGLVESETARVAALMAEKGMTADEIASFTNQIQAIINLTNNAVDQLPNSLSASGNTAIQDANDAFQDAMDYWENRIGAAESRFQQVQNEIDLLESQGKKAGAGYYQEQINQLQEFNDEGELVGGKLYLLQQQLAEAEAALAQVPEGSDEWWTIANEINSIHNEIDDVTMSIQDLKDAMADTHWYMFDEAHDRVSALTSDLENIRNILSNEEFFDDEGNFTEAGLGTLASYVQDLGVFEGALANAKAELDLFRNADGELEYDPNKTYVDAFGNDLSIDSEQDFYDAVEKAEGVYDDWNSKVIETRYNIKDLYEQQIDAIEEYTQTLVENYNEYTDAVKEALDSERDLYEFKKSTEQKSKNIASIERRIASLSGSTNAADIAERRKLQAELTDAKSDMDDHYYSHAKEQQSQALDNEMTAYETAMNTYIEGLRTKLEESTATLYMSYEEMGTETKSFIDGVTQSVILNAGNVESVYKSTGETIDDSLMTPWINAAAAIGTFASSEGALGLMNSWTEAKAGKPFYDFQTKVSGYLSKPWSSIIGAGGPVQTFKTSVTNIMSQIVSSVNTNVSGISGYIASLKTEIDKIKDTTIRVTTVYETTGNGAPPPSGNEDTGLKSVGVNSSSIDVGWLKTDANKRKETIDGTDYYKAQDGYYYPMSRLQWGINGFKWGFPAGTPRYSYAKGTTGTSRDEWALTDEPQFGDELVLVPGKDGNLSFMRKGTGVVPADMTQKLFELAQIPTSDLMNKNLTAIVPNITKNDFKNEFNFESLVHVDTVDSDTLPKLEKMVDKKIDDFSKALNYSLKRFAR